MAAIFVFGAQLFLAFAVALVTGNLLVIAAIQIKVEHEKEETKKCRTFPKKGGKYNDAKDDFDSYFVVFFIGWIC